MNSFFQFKQFTIHQEKTAMKVTEIACIQGAWTYIPNNFNDVLDIGLGTGLLSLMLAQNYPHIKITGIDVNEEAFLQSKKNIEASIFNSQIKCVLGDVRHHNFETKFDFIICNPPFFEGQLKSNTIEKNIAWHSEHLNIDQLMKAILFNLKDNGQFSILFPFDRKVEFEAKAADFNLFPQKYLYIRHQKDKPIKYFVGIFGFQQIEPLENIILDIRDNGSYSSQMIGLMKDFYLKIN